MEDMRKAIALRERIMAEARRAMWAGEAFNMQ